MYHQPPVDASPLYGQNRRRCIVAAGRLCRVFPLHPRRSKKLMWLHRKERERNQAPILGGGDLPARANTTAWGLME